jgi:hypothetical protein
MTSTPFTPRNAAKFVVKAVVHFQTAKAVETVMVDYTRFEEDDMIVDISGHLVGWYVSDKLKPLTDKAVDKVADKIVERRAKKADKQESTTE